MQHPFRRTAGRIGLNKRQWNDAGKAQRPIMIHCEDPDRRRQFGILASAINPSNEVLNSGFLPLRDLIDREPERRLQRDSEDPSSDLHRTLHPLVHATPPTIPSIRGTLWTHSRSPRGAHAVHTRCTNVQSAITGRIRYTNQDRFSDSVPTDGTKAAN
jgi:hypothetical protein